MRIRAVTTGAVTVAFLALLAFQGPAPAAAQPTFKWVVQTSYAAGDDLHLSFVNLAQKIKEMSGGRLTLEVNPGGTFVPPFDTLQAVNDGVIDAGGGDGDYWVGKHPAGSLFASAPAFGMDSITLLGWMHYGGGGDLFREYIQDALKFNKTVPFLLSPALAQPFGWFKKPVASPAEVKGLKYRTPGLPVDVMKEMGAAVVTVPAGEIVPALERGVIEAAEYFGPRADMILGLSDVRKVYMMPSYLQLGLVLNFFVNKDRWDKLPPDLQAIIRYATMAESADFYWRYLELNSKALEQLETEKGVTVHVTSREILKAQLAAWDRVFEKRGKDPFFAKVLESQKAWAKRVLGLKARINPPEEVALEHYWGKK